MSNTRNLKMVVEVGAVSPSLGNFPTTAGQSSVKVGARVETIVLYSPPWSPLTSPRSRRYNSIPQDAKIVTPDKTRVGFFAEPGALSKYNADKAELRKKEAALLDSSGFSLSKS